MIPVLINFIAAPGVGKSTMSALTYVKIKTSHNTSELVQEYAKQLVWSGRLEDLNNQWYVSKKQYEMLMSVYGKVEYTITDSGLLLGIYYNRNYENNVCDVEKTDKMILSNIKKFNNINIFLSRNSLVPYEKVGRVHDENESYKIEDELLSMLDSMGVKYLKIESDINNIDEIIDYILKEKECFDKKKC